MMKRLTFKQWYAIAVLIVIIIFGWLYLNENRYMEHQASGAIIDTWTQKVVPIEDLLPKE